MEEQQQKIEEIKKVNFIRDKKQMRVTIPAEIVDRFKIDPTKDQFGWLVVRDKDNISLNGFLMKETKEDGKKNSP